MPAKRLNSKAKGSSGEREACDFLHGLLQLDHRLERNLLQTREGGGDIYVGPDPDNNVFLVEVKRVEILNLGMWWVQAVASTFLGGLIPIVMFRQNYKQWEFLIPATYIGNNDGFIRLKVDQFALWGMRKLELVARTHAASSISVLDNDERELRTVAEGWAEALEPDKNFYSPPPPPVGSQTGKDMEKAKGQWITKFEFVRRRFKGLTLLISDIEDFINVDGGPVFRASVSQFDKGLIVIETESDLTKDDQFAFDRRWMDMYQDEELDTGKKVE